MGQSCREACEGDSSPYAVQSYRRDTENLWLGDTGTDVRGSHEWRFLKWHIGPPFGMGFPESGIVFVFPSDRSRLDPSWAFRDQRR